MQNKKSTSSADDAIKRIHLKAIQHKIDENAYEIVNTTARCAIYEWENDGWKKTSIEGSLFIFKFRNKTKNLDGSFHDLDGLAMAILNKSNTKSLKEYTQHNYF